jgi:sugar (pentulose or hexulose) kinase
LKENEPEIYHAAAHICEYTDWMTHRLTGEWTASINIASLRWYYDRNNGYIATYPQMRDLMHDVAQHVAGRKG